MCARPRARSSRSGRRAFRPRVESAGVGLSAGRGSAHQDTANALIRTRRARCVLIASGEIISQHITWEVADWEHFRRVFAGFTLGDGGGALVVETSGEDDGRGVLPGVFFADGRHWELSAIRGPGTAPRFDPAGCAFESDTRG